MIPRAPVPHVTHPRIVHAWRPRRLLGRIAEAVVAPFMLPVALFGAFLALIASRSMIVAGVSVKTGARPGASTLERTPSATYFVAGQTERGSTADAVEIRSMAEYAEKLGSRVAYGTLYDDLEMFFAEGGSRAFVARVVGAGATTGLLNLVDRAGAPLNTVRLTAKSPGAWSSTLTAQIADGVLADTFSVFLRLNGELVEQYLDQASPTAFVAEVNARSSIVTATDLGSATAAPNNNPAVLAATALSAGADDRASIVAGDYVAALARFGSGLGAGAVSVPGQSANAVHTGLIAHVKDNRRVALLAPPAGSTVATAKTTANGLRPISGSEFAEIAFPWVRVPDGVGGTRTISPEGYIAGVRARAHREAGPWRAPAGEIAIARRVVGVESELTQAQVDDLLTSRVNPIRTIAGTVRLYGWRSLSVDQVNYLVLTARDTLNHLAVLAEQRLERFVFAPIDGRGHLYAQIEAEMTAILEPMRAAGGLFEASTDDGDIIDPGYTVDAHQGASENEVVVDIGIRISPTAELITVSIVKVAFDEPLAA
jgi:hypothetical protein